MNLDEPHDGKVKATFESGAERFDRIYDPSESKCFLQRWIDQRFRRTMYMRFDETIRRVGPGDIRSVLDVGCGSGRYCVEYLKLGKKVTAIDMASNMLVIAREACEEAVPGGEIEYVLGDYLEYRFDERFDVAVLMGLFDYVEDSPGMLEKLRTDVKRLVLASFPRSDSLLNQIRVVRYFLRNCPLYLYSRPQLEEMFTAAGFEDHSIHATDREFYVSANA